MDRQDMGRLVNECVLVGLGHEEGKGAAYQTPHRRHHRKHPADAGCPVKVGVADGLGAHERAAPILSLALEEIDVVQGGGKGEECAPGGDSGEEGKEGGEEDGPLGAVAARLLETVTRAASHEAAEDEARDQDGQDERYAGQRHACKVDGLWSVGALARNLFEVVPGVLLCRVRAILGIDVDNVAGPIEGGNEVTLARGVASRKSVSATLSNSIPGERQGHNEEDYGQEGRHERPTLSRAPVRTARHPLLSFSFPM